MGMEDGLKELYSRREKAMQMGGAKLVAAQHTRSTISLIIDRRPFLYK